MRGRLGLREAVQDWGLAGPARPVGAGAIHAAPVPVPAGSVAPLQPATGGYFATTPLLAIVLLGLFGARLTELVPQLNVLRPTLLASAAAMVLVLLHSSKPVLIDVVKHPMFRLMALYGLWALFTAPFALWPGLAIESAIGLFIPAMVLCFVILACEPSPWTVDRISFGFVVAVAIQLAGVLAGGMTRTGNRITSNLSLDPNDLGSLVALTFPLAVGHAMRARGQKRAFAIAASILFIITLLRTGSRGGTLAFLIATLVFVCGFPGRRRVTLLMAVLMLAPVVWTLGPPEYRTRMKTMLSLDEDYNNTEYTGRRQVRERARQYYLENPVMGVGMFCFGLAEGIRNKEIGRTGKWSAPHNAYWQALSELGTPGGLAFFGMIVASALYGLRSWRWRARDGTVNAFHRPEYLASLAGFAIGAYFLSHAYFWPIFGIFALIALAARASATRAVGAAAPAPTGVRRSRGMSSFVPQPGQVAHQR
jgi:O-antigen ligase